MLMGFFMFETFFLNHPLYVYSKSLVHTYLAENIVSQRARSSWTGQNSACQHNTGLNMHARKPSIWQ